MLKSKSKGEVVGRTTLSVTTSGSNVELSQSFANDSATDVATVVANATTLKPVSATRKIKNTKDDRELVVTYSKDGALITRNIDRSHLWSVQTPQCFRLDVIRKALEAVRRKGIVVTDDTAACELIGQLVKLVPTATPNPNDALWIGTITNSSFVVG